MDSSAFRPSATRSLATTLLVSALALALAAPAAAFSNAWTQPKRVFAYAGAPTHAMTVDGGGKVHIATERGSGGIWYVTNAGGTWNECQLSTGNDRQPSIVVEGSVVHVAFARLTDGQKGLYTASSDQGGGGGCGWGETQRYSGGVSHTASATYGGTLSIAFRTTDKKLRFTRGSPGNPAWTLLETIDGSCCTSGVDLALTHTGAPRVVYGDGTSKGADGLKYGVRISNAWKKSKAYGGRVKHVSMALDLLPGLFGTPPSNSPKIAFVVKGQGLFYTAKGSSGVGGAWERRDLGNYSMAPQIQYWSNELRIVYGKNGSLWTVLARAAIWQAGKLSGTGGDGKPQLASNHLTFSRSTGTKGIYYTRLK